MLNIAHTVKIVLFRILTMLITYFYTILVSSFENLYFNTEMCVDNVERMFHRPSISELNSRRWRTIQSDMKMWSRVTLISHNLGNTRSPKPTWPWYQEKIEKNLRIISSMNMLAVADLLKESSSVLMTEHWGVSLSLKLAAMPLLLSCVTVWPFLVFFSLTLYILFCLKGIVFGSIECGT